MLEHTFSKTNLPDKVAFLDGALLLIDKPLEWTSFDVVNKLRHTLKHALDIKGKKRKVKVGHAGTLDPMATGLLLVCTGKYTKKIESLTGMNKGYDASLKLGATTPSYDSESEEDAQFSIESLTEAQVRQAISSFEGYYDQYPPMYSAIKVKGQKLYQLARRGISIELKTRPVTIHSIETQRIEIPHVDISCSVSKGTYIRSLAHDIGASLNNGAYLTGLRRTFVGPYRAEDALSIDEAVEWIRASAYMSEDNV